MERFAGRLKTIAESDQYNCIYKIYIYKSFFLITRRIVDLYMHRRANVPRFQRFHRFLNNLRYVSLLNLRVCTLSICQLYLTRGDGFIGVCRYRCYREDRRTVSSRYVMIASRIPSSISRSQRGTSLHAMPVPFTAKVAE